MSTYTNFESGSIDKALTAVALATHHQVWQDVDATPTNEIANVLFNIRMVLADAEATYRHAADKAREAQDYDTSIDYRSRAYAYLEALDVITDLYCRSLREYAEANDYARSAFC